MTPFLHREKSKPFTLDWKIMPGSRIPIVTEARIQKKRPKIIVILPWNIKEEVMMQQAYVREWGGRFVTAVPKLEVS